MKQLPDVHAWIKVIDENSGVAQPDSTTLWYYPHPQVTVRYSFANDSHQAAGPLTVVGALHCNGVRVQPNGQDNVVPVQQITLQPGQIWSKEYHFSETLAKGDKHTYKASLLGDVGNSVKEEDDKNNVARMTFYLHRPVD